VLHEQALHGAVPGASKSTALALREVRAAPASMGGHGRALVCMAGAPVSAGGMSAPANIVCISALMWRLLLAGCRCCWWMLLLRLLLAAAPTAALSAPPQPSWVCIPATCPRCP
jgi:hypothetical protein